MIASEQTRADVVIARESFFAEQLKDVPLENVVVLDESYATTTFTRLRGRCPRHRRLRESVPAGHWKTLTILGAITVAGVLAAATVNAATDAEVFGTFIRQCLVPTLRPGMVVVMDNLSAHKVSGIREAIEGASCRLVYLPPYSPDMSPIENIWSKTKNVLRLLAARTVDELAVAVATALKQITPGDCRGCFDGCGYSLHLK